ncbi:FAD-dependent monooxygenase [Roseobacter sp. EG26]|uniref:FAD-dependent monooxygenase n=1 Tax=Roseobacter sp. EG26 TaxID=3412477 RepID=UPI003CE47A3E
MDNPPHTVLMRTMVFDCDILIVGGGLNGPTLALALASAGQSVIVVDALPVKTRKNAGFDGRSYALALTSARLLQALGIWDKIEDYTQPMLDIKVTDGRAGEGASPFFMHFDHAEIEEGPMGYMVEDRHLRPALLNAVQKEKAIRQINGDVVIDQKLDPTGISVVLQSGKTLRAKLLVGCDGRRSGTAARSGIKRTGWEYNQTALVCALDHALPHNGVAHQFFMPAGPLAILPLKGNRSSIVWSETTENAHQINAMSDADYLNVLRPRFGSFLGDLSLTGARFTYPLSLSLANELVAPRVALVGDAAHGIHPIAGQGLNAGLRDVAALADVVTDASRRGEDIGTAAVLSRYQQWRRFDNTALALATDAFNKLFSNDNPILRGLRDIGMGIVGNMPGMRRGFIREAAGLTGDLPRLLKGEKL